MKKIISILIATALCIFVGAASTYADEPTMDTPNLKEYAKRCVDLSGYAREAINFVAVLHVIESWWDGMDSKEQAQAKKWNEWMVEKLREEGNPVPGILRTIQYRKLTN